MGPGGRDASPCQMSSKSINPLRRYRDFSILPRDAMVARYMLSSFVCVSDCLCVCVTDTPGCCAIIAKHRIMQTMLRDSAGTLSFLVPEVWAKFEWGHPNGAQNVDGVG